MDRRTLEELAGIGQHIPSEERRKFLKALDTKAWVTWQIYNAYVNVGFSSEHALWLTSQEGKNDKGAC